MKTKPSHPNWQYEMVIKSGLNQGMDKQALRQSMQNKRLALSDQVIAKAASTICDDLSEHPDWKTWQHIGAYYPHWGECSPLAACSKAYQENKSIYLPSVQNQTLTWQPWHPTCTMQANAWGILEPTQGPSIDVAALDVLWVPGLAFDQHFMRLGLGGGYYDRLLAQQPQLHTIGLGYDFQLLTMLPTDTWDQPMTDLLIVETDTVP